MYAYNRTEADQTDAIALCATREEWQLLINMLGRQRWNHEEHQITETLTNNLIYAGVYE